MALLTDTLIGRTNLVDVFTTWMEMARETATKRRLYRETRNELQSLNNKELADIGIARAEIQGIAYRVAYGEDA